MKSDLKALTVELRRRHILEAAAKVFAKRGYRSASIRDVAKAAGVADGTIYNVFSNKAELLLCLLEPLAQGIPPTRPPHGEPKDAAVFLAGLFQERWKSFSPQMLGILRVVLSEVLVDPDIRKRFFSRVMSPAMKPLESQLASLASRRAISSRNAMMTSRALTAMFMGLLMLRMVGDEEIESRGDGALADVVALLADGLRPRER
jgi:TetR/AcrR family fatty acid metabolism transcriptional regulator